MPSPGAYPTGLPFTAATLTDDPNTTTDEAYWLGKVTKPVSDALDSYLYGDGYLTRPDRGWVPLPMAGTWVRYGSVYRYPAYRTLGDRVEFRGLIKGGAGIGSGNPISTAVPAPAFQRLFCQQASSLLCSTVMVTTAGVMYVSANFTGADATAYLSLEGIEYFTS